MNRYGRRITLAVAALVIVMAGCSTLPEGRDTAGVNQTIKAWKAAFEARDVEEMMNYYSGRYRGPHGGKRQVYLSMQAAKRDGALDNITIDLSEAKAIVDGGAATYGPIFVKGGPQEMTLGFRLLRENDGVWRFISTLPNGGI